MRIVAKIDQAIVVNLTYSFVVTYLKPSGKDYQRPVADEAVSAKMIFDKGF